MSGVHGAAEFAGGQHAAEETLRGSGESNPSSAFGPAAFPDPSFHSVSSCWKIAHGTGVSSALWSPWTMWLGTVGQSVLGSSPGRVGESPVVAAWGCPDALRCPWEAATQQSARSPRGKRLSLGWMGRVCGEDWLAWGGPHDWQSVRPGRRPQAGLGDAGLFGGRPPALSDVCPPLAPGCL